MFWFFKCKTTCLSVYVAPMNECQGFCGGVAEDLVFLAYDAALMSNWIPVFWDNICPLSSSSKGEVMLFGIVALEDGDTALP